MPSTGDMDDSRGGMAPRDSETAGTVSVIIPTYNRADLLSRAVASVLAQTYKPFEVIVIDDGSTDDTADRCREWGDRIRYIRIANSGVAAARNHGVETARGEWVAFLDSDDTWEPTKLEVQMAAVHEIPGPTWSLTGCEVVDGSGQSRKGPQSFAGTFPVFRDYGYRPERLFDEHLSRFEVVAAGARHTCYRGDLFRLLFLGNVGLPSTALLRRALFGRVGGFDAVLRGRAEDTEFFHRVATYSPVVIVMTRLTRYRAAQSDSLTAASNAAALTEVALQSVEAASKRRPMTPLDRRAWRIGRRRLLLRLAYMHLSVNDPASVQRTLRRLGESGLPLGGRGAALWAASLLPPSALHALHHGKRLLRRAVGR